MIVGDDDAVGADHEARAKRTLTLEAVFITTEEFVEALHWRAFGESR